MKIAIVGSRNIIIDNLEKYLPRNITEIVSGRARGVDSCAKVYAESKGIPIKEFLPDYEKYGRSAPLKRNDLIIEPFNKIICPPLRLCFSYNFAKNAASCFDTKFSRA